MGYGIDIGSTAVKVVAVRRSLGGFKVTAAARHRVPRSGGDPKAGLQKAVHEALGGRNGARTGVVGLTGRDINLQVMQQPAMKPLNYRVMMGYELDQRRGGAGDVYLDYCTLREPDQFFPQYLSLIGIGKSSTVDERIDLAARAAVDVRDAVPNSFGLYAAYRNSYEVENGTVMLLDIGAENMDVAFVRGGRLIFARNVSSGSRIVDGQVSNMLGVSAEDAEALKVVRGNLGPSGSPEDEEAEEELRAPVRSAAGQLAGAITSSIHHAKVQLNDREFAVDKVYLSGGGARLRGLPGYLTGALKVPVEVLDPFRKLDASAVEKLGGAEFKALPTDMAVAIGLAQLSVDSGGSTTLSILPDRLKKRRNFFRGPFWLGAGGVVTALTLLVLTVTGWMRQSAQESAYTEFSQKYGAVARRIEELDAVEVEQREVSAKIEALAAYAGNGRACLETISKLKRNFPPGVLIREIRLTDPTGRGAGGAERTSALFVVRGRGQVRGEIESEGADGIRLKGHTDPYPEAEIMNGLQAGVIRFPMVVRGVLLAGEVDENARTPALDVLNGLCTALTDSSQGLKAAILNQAASSRAGWRRFEILVTQE